LIPIIPYFSEENLMALGFNDCKKCSA